MSSPLRAAIIDDEPLARMRLARLLSALPDVEIVGNYADGRYALDGLRATPADVLFLDIRMPEIDGFQLLRRLPVPVPLVVFVSAYGERALEAFDVEAVDYLLKPLSPERVRNTVARVCAWRKRDDDTRTQHAQPSGRYAQRIAVPDGARLRMVEVNDITQLVAQGNYVELILAGRSLLLRETMASLVARLDPTCFIRIHRSRALRIDLIEHMQAHGAGRYLLRLKDGSHVVSGSQYRGALRAVLGIAGGN